MYFWLKKILIPIMAIVMLIVALVSCSNTKQTGGKQSNTTATHKVGENDLKKESENNKNTSRAINEKEYELIKLIIEEGLLMVANYSEDGVRSIIDSGYPYLSLQMGSKYMVDNGENDLTRIIHTRMILPEAGYDFKGLAAA